VNYVTRTEHFMNAVLGIENV